MNGVDNNHVNQGEVRSGRSMANESSIPPKADKTDTVAQQNITTNLVFALPAAFAFSFSSIFAPPVFLGGMLVKYCKNNRDAHLGNEGNPAAGQKTINPDRSNMGFFHWTGIARTKIVEMIIGGISMKCALYPRTGERSKVQIVEGPSDAVGLTVGGIDCHKKNWPEIGRNALEKLVAQKHKPLTLPVIPRSSDMDPGSTKSTNHLEKIGQVQPQQTSVDNSSPAAVSLNPIYRDLNTGSTTLINNSSSAALPAPSSNEGKARLIESIEPDGITKNAEANKLSQDIQKARKEKDRVKADPHTTPEEKGRANRDYHETIDNALAFEHAGKYPLEPSVRDKFNKTLERIEKSKTESGEIGAAQIKMAQQNRHDAAEMQNVADALKKILKAKPNATEIIIKTTKGPLSLKKDEVLKKINVLEHKAQAQHKESLNNFKGGVTKLPDAVAGKVVGELKKQTQHLAGTVKTAGALIFTDAVFDLLEGRCDASTALYNTATNTILGTAEQVGTSVVYEGLTGAVTTCKSEWAEKIPGLGTTVIAYNCFATLGNAKTFKEGLTNVAYMGVDTAGPMAITGAFTALIGTAGLPALIVGKVSWRVAKIAWGWARSK